jgi:glycerol-3-phosphate dehydrogenase
MNRDLMVNKLMESGDSKWDVVIIGGGATGLGIALDASIRGFKTILIEQSDFTKGTSGRSTKLVHGGVRYLAKGDILLVMEALMERGRLLQNSPQLTRNQEFLIPLYSWWDIIVYTVGLTFYDFLAGRKSLGRSHFIGRKKTLFRIPTLLPAKLKGSVVYHDGQFDDARMGITLAKSAIETGAVILNYFKAVSLLKNSDGKLNSVKALDFESGKEYLLASNCIINATGVFSDSVMHLDNHFASATIRPSQGTHLVLDRSFLAGDAAIMIPKTSDGRVLFCIPWYDHVVVGTTDTPVNYISLEPQALEEEIEFILANASRYLQKAPSKQDVLSCYAGLRPLAANPDRPESTKEISRRHKIYVSSSGLISIVGGKWTTYRLMAQEVLDKAIHLGKLTRTKCLTQDYKLYGYRAESKSGHFSIYGSEATEIEEMIKTNPVLGLPVHSQLPYCQAEVMWIIRNEMPRTVEDVLSRRTRALILNAAASIEMAPIVASLLAHELSYDKKWEMDQIENFTKLAQQYLLKSNRPS